MSMIMRTTMIMKCRSRPLTTHQISRRLTLTMIIVLRAQSRQRAIMPSMSD